MRMQAIFRPQGELDINDFRGKNVWFYIAIGRYCHVLKGEAVRSSSFRSLKTDGTQLAEVVEHCGAADSYHSPHKVL